MSNSAAPEMKISALAPWYGGNRTLAETCGQQLGELHWCGVPFCGGLPELPKIRTRAGVANDKHKHLINLARVVQVDELVEQMFACVDRLLFHPDEFAAAQRRCLERETSNDLPAGGLFGGGAVPGGVPVRSRDVQWAADYFVCCWMGRGGSAGQEWEFAQNIAMRWTASGGGSAKRWRSAVESLRAWCAALKLWEFTCLDAFAFLDEVKDRPSHGLYVDAPWPDAGENYKHKFTEADQVRLAGKLAEFRQVRVVVRFGDHPLIRRLYPMAKGWTWIEQDSRNQAGNMIAEVLIVNSGALIAGRAA